MHINPEPVVVESINHLNTNNMSSSKNQTIGSKLMGNVERVNANRESRFKTGLYDFFVREITKVAAVGIPSVVVDRAKFGEFDVSLINKEVPEDVVRQLRHEDICIKYRTRMEFIDVEHDQVEVKVPECYLCPGERQRMTQHP